MLREPSDRDEADEPAWARIAVAGVMIFAAVAAIEVIYVAFR